MNEPTRIPLQEITTTTHHRAQEIGDDYIPVNKGHFDMDTEERIVAFYEKLGRGWEGEYKEYRSSWGRLPRQKIIRDYPILLDVELASSCNLNCPMCYTTTQHFKENVKAKLMKWDLYCKIVEEVAGKVFALRLSWRGESTLHKKFVDAVRFASDRGIREISFLTNGWKLDLDYFKQLEDAGASWITVSFDGIGEEYNRIRAPLVYEEVLKNLREIANYKKKNNIEKPVIKVQGIWPAIRSNPESYYNTMSAVSDLVAFNPLIDYLEKDDDIQYESNFSCPQIYERMFVSSTGEVMMCNSDEYGEETIGDANNQAIHEIWHGGKLSRVRSIHAETDGFLSIPTCRKCFFPRKTYIDEEVLVNGRKIQVENYTNRAQKVGS